MFAAGDREIGGQVVADEEAAARGVDRRRREADLLSILLDAVERSAGGYAERGFRESLGGRVSRLAPQEDRQACAPREQHRNGDRASTPHASVAATKRAKTSRSYSVSTTIVIVAGKADA